MDSDVNLEVIAGQCPKQLTGADLYSLCASAMMSAIRGRVDSGTTESKEPLLVMQCDFLSALSGTTPSVSEDELRYYQDLHRKFYT